MKIPSLIPVLKVGDVKEAIAFYTLLGFCEETQYSFADEQGILVHAHLYKDDSVLFLGLSNLSYNKENASSGKIGIPGIAERGLGITLIVQTQHLDEIYRLVKAKGLPILYEPANEWYGDRVFLFIDPFGYEWKVSQMLT